MNKQGVMEILHLIATFLLITDVQAFWCPDNWLHNGTSCYSIEHNKTVLWSQARDVCSQLDAHLVTIEEYMENTFLTESGPDATGLDYWIGYKKAPNTNAWAWVDGSSSTWLNWDPGEPDGDGDCTRLTNVHGGKWRDRSCTDFQNPYICERLKECTYVQEVLDAGPPSLNQSRNIVGTVVNYTCNVGWIFPDNMITNEIKCELGGEWSSINNCQVVVCSAPPVIANSTANSTANSYLSVVSYTCHEGFWFSREELNKSRVAQCQLDAQWSVNITSCDPVTCLHPVTPYATWNSNSSGIGAEVNYTCDVGYEFPGNLSSTTFKCQNDGEWSPNATEKQCKIKHCPWPWIPNSTPNTDINAYGTKVTFTCTTGYRYNDSATVKHTTCTADKSWDVYIPPCEAVHCPKLDNVSFAVMNSSEAVYGSAVNFSCFDGYFFPDGTSYRIIKCNKHAAWTAKVPACRLQSEIPEVPLNVEHVSAEAEGAVSVGTVTIALIVTLFVCVVILDLVTCKRQIDILRANLAGCTDACCGEGEEEYEEEVEEHKAKIIKHDQMDSIDVESQPTSRPASRQKLSESQLLGSLASLKSNKVAPTTDDIKENDAILTNDAEDALEITEDDSENFLIEDETLGDDLLADIDTDGLHVTADLDLDAELAEIEK